MNQLRDVYLHGRLAKRFGKKHRLSVDSPSEAIRALSSQYPGFRETISTGNYAVVRGKLDDETYLTDCELNVRFGSCPEMHLIPEPKLAGLDPLTQFIISATVLAATTIISSLLAPQIDAPDPNKREREENSGIFDGPVNVTEQGHPIPYIAGLKVRVGSVVGASGIETTDIPISQRYDGEGGYGGGNTGGFRGDNNNLQLEKGGKGGGQARAAQEDPNTLRSNTTARIIDLVGEGPIGGLIDGLKSVYFDGTPVENPDGTFNFTGVEVQERFGEADQEHLPSFSAVESNPREIGVECVYGDTSNNRFGRVEPVETISNSLVDRARVVISLDNGLNRQDTETGDLLRTSVIVAIDVQVDGGGFIEVVKHTFSGKTVSTYPKSVDVELPSGNTRQVRVRRVTPDREEASHTDNVFFSSIVEIIDAKLTYPYTAYMGVTVDALQFGSRIAGRAYELAGTIVDVPSNYDPVEKTYTGTWDGTWKKAATENAAWHVRNLVINNRYGLGRYTSALPDKWELYQIAQYNDQLIPDGRGGLEPRYTLNTVLNTREEAYDQLNKLVSTFRGMSYWSGNAITFRQDRPSTNEPHILNPSNSVEGKVDYSEPSIKDRNSVYVVMWNDPKDGFRLTPEVVEDQRLIREIGWKEKQIVAIGCTSRGQARRIGKFSLDDEWNAQKRATWGEGIGGKLKLPGDEVQIFDPEFYAEPLRHRGGRVKTATTTAVTIGHPLALDPNKEYSLKVVLPDGTVEVREVTFTLDSEGFTEVLNPILAFSDSPIPDAVWAVQDEDTAPLRFRVESVTEESSIEHKLQARIYDPTKYARIEQGLTLPPEAVSNLLTGPIAKPRGLNVQEFWKQVGDTRVPSLSLSWTPSPDSRVELYEAQFIEPGSENFEELSRGVEVFRDVVGVVPGIYRFRVRAVGFLGTPSAWAPLTVDVSGSRSTLPDVADLQVVTAESPRQTYLTWSRPYDPRPFKYGITLTTEDGTEDLAEITAQEYIVRQAGTYTVYVRYMGHESTGVPVVVTEEDLPSLNWDVIDGRPTTLAELDAAAQEALQTANTVAEAAKTAADEALTVADAAIEGTGNVRGFEGLSLLNWFEQTTRYTGWTHLGAMPSPMNQDLFKLIWDFSTSGEKPNNAARYPVTRPVNAGSFVQTGIEIECGGSVEEAVLNVLWFDESGSLISRVEIDRGTGRRLEGIAEAPEGSASASFDLVPVVSELAGIGFISINEPYAAYALTGQTEVEEYSSKSDEVYARFEELERAIAGQVTASRQLISENRTSRALYRENVETITNDRYARVVADMEISTRVEDIEENYMTAAQISQTYMTESETEQSIAIYNLNLNSTFQSLKDDLGSNYITAAEIDQTYMTQSDVNQSISLYNLDLNSTFQSLKDDLASNYLTSSDIDQTYMTQAEVDQTISLYNLNLNSTFQSLKDDLNTNYITSSQISQIYMTQAEVDQTISLYNLNLNSSFNSLNTRIGNIETSYITEATANQRFTTYSDVNQAIGGYNLDLNSDFSGLKSSVNLTAQTVSDLQGNVSATYGFELDADGNIASMKAHADGSGSSIRFLADKFLIATSGAAVDPFGIQGNTVTMQNVEIQGNLLVSGTVDAPQLKVGAVSNSAAYTGWSSGNLFRYSWRDIANVNFASIEGGTISVALTLSCGNLSNQDVAVTIRLITPEGPRELHDVLDYLFENTNTAVFNFTNIPAGTGQYKIQAMYTNGRSSETVNPAPDPRQWNLAITELKR